MKFRKKNTRAITFVQFRQAYRDWYPYVIILISVLDHVLTSYPDYETITEYESNPARIKDLPMMEAEFPSNVKTKLEDTTYELYFLRLPYHDLPDGERMEEEFEKLRKTINLLTLIRNSEK